MTLSLDLILRPKSVNLAGNAVPFVLTTDNAFSDEGAKGMVDLQVPALPADTDTLTISYNDGEVELEFTFVDIPNDSGLQIQHGGSYAGNISNWIDLAFLPALRANPFLDKDYKVEKEGTDKVRFSANGFGSSYELSFAGVNGITSTPIGWTSTVQTQPIDRIKRPNFKIVALLQIRQQGMTNYSEVSLELDAIDNIAAFDLGPVLEGDWYEIPLPDHTINAPTIFSNCIAEFYVKFSERFGSNNQTQRLIESNVYRCLPGGFSYDDARKQSVQVDYISQNKFLNRLPNGAEISLNQTYYLWWYLIDAGVSEADIQVSIVYEDGTDSGGGIKLFDASSLAVHKLLCIPISLSAIAAVGDPKQIYSFDIWISPNNIPGTNYTEKRTFYRADRPVSDALDIAYLNSFGVVETFRCKGDIRFNLNATHKYAQKAKDPRSSDARSVHSKASVSPFVEVNTGYLSGGEALQLADLLCSKSQWLLENDGWRKVRIEESSLTYRQSRGVEMYNTVLKLFNDVDDKRASHA